MNTSLSTLLGLSIIAAAGAVPTTAQSANAMMYDSSTNVHRPGKQKFGSPEDDARPGERFYKRAVSAYAHGKQKFAADMYKVSASWGYKPSAYNLGVMYIKGQGVKVDRPLAMAWFAIAAERDDKQYVDARNMVYGTLSEDEIAQANVDWRDLKETYSDEHAMRRAKTRWAEVRNGATGSHLGAIGNLSVGGSDNTNSRHIVGQPGVSSDGGTGWGLFIKAGYALTGGNAHQMDGSTAYQQFHESSNPYDRQFGWRVSPDILPIGTTTVGPLLPVNANGGASNTPQSADPRQHNFY